jgi:hypothetical protein
MKNIIFKVKFIVLMGQLALCGQLFAPARVNQVVPAIIDTTLPVDELTINASFTVYEPLSEVVNEMAAGRSQMAFLHDSMGQQFVLKCNVSAEGAIHEALGAYIGSSVGIHINKVKIIPPYVPCVGRKDPSLIATLHTCVPGVEVANIPTMNTNIDIYNGLVEDKNLACLCEHDELCDIVALDIFLDNFDRHNYNLFFDQKNKHFHAIDMDMIFSNVSHICLGNESLSILDASMNDLLFHDSIATDAEKFLERFPKKRKLSPKEVRALKRIAATLTNLVNTFPPKKIYNVWMKCANDARYVYTENKKQCIQIILLYNSYIVTRFLRVLLATLAL